MEPIPKNGELAGHDVYLRGLTRALVSCEHDADDLVQDVWVEAIEKPPPSRSHYRGWLRVVTLHALSRTWKQRRSRRGRERRAARAEAVRSVMDELGEDSIRDELVSMVDALSAPYREVIRLRYLDDRRIEEVSNRLGRSPSTVRTQTTRGLRILRRRIEEKNGRSALLPAFSPAALLAWLLAFGKRSSFALRATVVVMSVGAGVLLLSRNKGVDRPGAPPSRVAALTPSVPVQAESVLLAGMGAELVREPISNEVLTASPPASSGGMVAPAAIDRSEPVEIARVPVRGRVAHGHGVSEYADVVALHPDLPEDGEVVATSDADGRFSIPEANPEWRIYARQDGFLPSRTVLLESLPRDPGGPLEVLLGIPLEFGQLTVRVVDADGNAVPGVRVRNHLGADTIRIGKIGKSARVDEHVHWFGGETDGRGLITIPKAYFERNRLKVEPPGRPSFLEYTKAPPKMDELLEIRLPELASIAGRVVHRDGSPAAGAHIRFDRGPILSAVSIEADEEGRFRLEVAPGAYSLSVIARGVHRGRSCLADVAVGEGEVANLELELTRASTIRGVVLNVDPATEAVYAELEEQWIAEKRVRLFRRDVMRTERVRLGADRAFRFVAPSDDYVLRILDRSGRTLAWLDEVRSRPGGPIRIDAGEGSSTGSIGGRIAGREGLLGSARLYLDSTALSEPMKVPIEDVTGRFRAAALPPAAYFVRVQIPGFGLWRVAEVELNGDHVDLGELTPPNPARVSLRLVFPSHVRMLKNRHSDVRLRAGQTRVWPNSKRWVHEANGWELEAVFEEVPPGEFEVFLQTQGIADVRHRLLVADGGDVAARIELEEGVQTTFHLVSDEVPRQLSKLRMTLEGPSGTQSFYPRGTSPMDFGLGASLRVRLPRGLYCVTVETDCGLSGEVVVDVGARGQDPVELALER